MKLLFVAVITATFVITQEAAVVVEGEGQYTVVAPKVLYPEHDYNVAVAVHNTKEPVEVEISIEGLTSTETKTIKLPKPNELKHLSLKIPKFTDGIFKLKVKGVKGLLFTHTKDLDTFGLNLRSFIQMDKKVYWPGETIYYRVVFLDKTLRPVQPNSNVSIVIEDTAEPIVVIRDFKVVNGVYSGKYLLTNSSFFGNYRISIEYASPYEIGDVAFFTVIEPPTSFIEVDSVVLKTGEVKVFIMANITNKPVFGRATLFFESLEKKYVTDVLNGTATMILNFTKEEKRNEGRYSLVTVRVEDNSTKEMIRGGTYLHVNQNRYVFKCVKSYICDLFTPNEEESVSFKITHKNGSSVADTKSIVRAIYTENVILVGDEVTRSTSRKFTFETRLNEASIAEFKILLPELPVIAHGHHFYNLELVYDGEIKDMFNLYPKVKRPAPVPQERTVVEPPKEWFYIKTVQNDVAVGALAIFTLNSSSPIQDVNYYVVARGLIIEADIFQLARPEKIFNITVPVTDLMMPNSRVYVISIDDKGNFYYGETTIKVNFKLQNEIEIVAPEVVKPGSNVTFKIKTLPKSFVALTGVDSMVGSVINDIRILELKSPSHLGKDSNIQIMTNAISLKDFNLGVQSPTDDDYFGDDDLSYDDDDDDIDEDQLFHHVNIQASSDGLILRKGESYAVEDTWIFDNIDNTETDTFEWTKMVPEKGHSWLIKAFAVHPDKGVALLEKSITIKSRDEL